MNTDADPFAILFEENTHTDSSLLLRKRSVAVRVRLLEFFMNLAHAFKLINLSGDIQC